MEGLMIRLTQRKSDEAIWPTAEQMKRLNEHSFLLLSNSHFTTIFFSKSFKHCGNNRLWQHWFGCHSLFAFPFKTFLGAWCGLFSAIHIKSWRKHKSWPLTLSLLEIGRISDPLRTSGRSSSSIEICMFVPRNEALGLVILLQIHPKITGGATSFKRDAWVGNRNFKIASCLGIQTLEKSPQKL